MKTFFNNTKDLIITILLWLYYTIGFIVLFMPFYFLALVIVYKRENSYQFLNSLFYKLFFTLTCVLIPKLTVSISNEVKSIRSSVIICNHRSYLDPILLISLFPKQKTIVKGTFFKVPIFGWILKLSGYIPYFSDSTDATKMYDTVTGLQNYLLSGGTIFIFPEGTRSKDGSLGLLRTGAFRIAKVCKAPIAVVYIQNTERVFRPGRCMFDTNRDTIISVELLHVFSPDCYKNNGSTKKMMNDIRDMYLKKMGI